MRAPGFTEAGIHPNTSPYKSRSVYVDPETQLGQCEP